MGWVKVDDQLHAHPKVRRAWRDDPEALGLHLLALSYASAYLTDGVVPAQFVADQIPNPGRRIKAAEALLRAGLWEEADGGFAIHDFLDYNESRAHAEARRRRDSERKRSAIR